MFAELCGQAAGEGVRRQGCCQEAIEAERCFAIEAASAGEWIVVFNVVLALGTNVKTTWRCEGTLCRGSATGDVVQLTAWRAWT
jgi:hypothetical protein